MRKLWEHMNGGPWHFRMEEVLIEACGNRLRFVKLVDGQDCADNWSTAEIARVCMPNSKLVPQPPAWADEDLAVDIDL
jgi:hypothetical protein